MKKDDKEEDEVEKKAAEDAVMDIEHEKEEKSMIEKKAATMVVEQIEGEKGNDSDGGELSQEEIEKKAAELAVE